MKDALREVRMALLEADVNYKVVKEFINKINEQPRQRSFKSYQVSK